MCKDFQPAVGVREISEKNCWWYIDRSLAKKLVVDNRLLDSTTSCCSVQDAENRKPQFIDKLEGAFAKRDGNWRIGAQSFELTMTMGEHSIS